MPPVGVVDNSSDEDFLVGCDEDDDECVIVDGEHNKAATVVDDEGGRAGNGNSDEVEIVAEKGQIACRDYPHARYSCSKFSFVSTSHVMYCNMCYCYVCDARAPCKNWGNGTSKKDHCHATDKEPHWKTMRHALKLLNPGASSSSPETPHRVDDVCPTMASSSSSRQEPVIINAAAPQPPLSSVICLGRQPAASFANRGPPVPQRASQNKPRYRSLRMSASMPETVGPRRRNGRGTVYKARTTAARSTFQTSSSSSSAPIASQAAQATAAAAPADTTTNSSTDPSPPNAAAAAVAAPPRGRQPRSLLPPTMPSRKSTRLACNATPGFSALRDGDLASSSRAAPKSQVKKPRS